MNNIDRIKNDKRQKERGVILSVSLLVAFLIYSFLSVTSYAQEQAGGKDGTLYPGGLASLAKNILMAYDLFEEGKTLYENEDYLNARIKFQQALLRDPDNNKAKKYLSLCDKKRVAVKKSNKTSQKTEKMIDEEEMAFLKELETRIANLETEQPIQYVPEPEQEKEPETTPAQTSAEESKDNTSPNDQTKITPSLEEIRKAKKSENLINQGDEFYAKRDYEKAYKYYKEAFEHFNAR